MVSKAESEVKQLASTSVCLPNLKCLDSTIPKTGKWAKYNFLRDR